MTKSLFTKRYAKFRRLLIAARKENNLTQEEVAEHIGWSQTDVSKVERGVRRLDLIEFLEFARAIGIDVAEFIEELEKK